MIGRRRARRPDVTVYTRRGCHLCEQAEAAAARITRGGRARLRIVDVDTDPALATRYGVRVPVVTIDGQEAAELEVDPAALRAALRAARQA